MSIITINEVDLELDLLNADVVERYEMLNRQIVEKIKEPKQYSGLSNADAMRIQCRYIDEFFDELFEPGTAERLFGKGSNLGTRMEGFAIVAAAGQNASNQIYAISDRYGIERVQNRAQRRASAKAKKK